jgi:hypothetical protein
MVSVEFALPELALHSLVGAGSILQFAAQWLLSQHLGRA